MPHNTNQYNSKQNKIKKNDFLCKIKNDWKPFVLTCAYIGIKIAKIINKMYPWKINLVPLSTFDNSFSNKNFPIN